MKPQQSTRSTWRPYTLALLLALSCAAALARHHSHARPATGTPGEFDYYVLSLSWSPTYCLTHQDDHSQCGGKGYGFVLHGLWPQFNTGSWPQSCSKDAALSSDARQVGDTVYPSPKLVEHEWQRHGTCSGLDAISYFRTADKARASVHIPSGLDAPPANQSLTATQIAAEILEVNPQMPADAITVACGRGELSEVRVCLTRDLEPRSCGKGVRSTCPAAPVDIPATRGH